MRATERRVGRKRPLAVEDFVYSKAVEVWPCDIQNHNKFLRIRIRNAGFVVRVAREIWVEAKTASNTVKRASRDARQILETIQNWKEVSTPIVRVGRINHSRIYQCCTRTRR